MLFRQTVKADRSGRQYSRNTNYRAGIEAGS